MPRNAAGVYTLPDPPRVPNTTIDSPDENITRDDIGAELTNSLDRNGRGGMLAPFRIADGTMAAPGLGFLNDPDNGLYRIGADDWAVAVQGQKVMEFTPNTVTLSTGVAFTVTGNLITFGPGSVVAPTIEHAGFLTIRGGNAGVRIINNAGVQQNFSVSDAGDTVMVGNLQVGGQITLPGGIITSGGAGSLFLQTGGGVEVRILNSGGPNHLRLQGGANPSIATSGGSLSIPVAIIDMPNIIVGGGTSTFGGAVTINGGLILPNGSITTGGVSDIFLATGSGLQVRILNGAAQNHLTFSSGVRTIIGTGGAGPNIGIDYRTTGTSTHDWYVGATVRMYLGTHLHASNDGTFTGDAQHQFYQSLDAGFTIAQFKNSCPTLANQFGVQFWLLGDPNDSTHYFTAGIAGGGQNERISQLSNGGLRNFQANNVNLCDAAVKDFIEPLASTDALALWKAHRDVQWCSFKYRDQNHDDPNFGYLAQDIETKFAGVAPWLVEEMEVGLPGTQTVKRKYVYSADLDNIGHAVLSAAQRRIEALESALAKNGITLN